MSSQVLAGVEQLLPIWPVATLRPVTMGAEAAETAVTGAAAIAVMGAVNAPRKPKGLP